MVGFLTGVTRSPFTSVILVLEMTDRHNVIFHLIFAGMIASLVSILIDKHSLYDHFKVQYIKDLNTIEETEMTEQVVMNDTDCRLNRRIVQRRFVTIRINIVKIRVTLFYKQQLPEFWQRPQRIINQLLQLINMVADRLEKGFYFFIIINGLFAHVFNIIGFFTLVYHFVNIRS